ncbi:MAG: hypothetical protein IKP40_14025 [Clostridia bacterium]|nr:hypothetical protein [Clostridia bacterium]
MAQGEFIQVGVTAMRDKATGRFMPAVPLYIEADDSARAGETELVQEIGRLFAMRLKADIDRRGPGIAAVVTA